MGMTIMVGDVVRVNPAYRIGPMHASQGLKPGNGYIVTQIHPDMASKAYHISSRSNVDLVSLDGANTIRAVRKRTLIHDQFATKVRRLKRKHERRQANAG